MVKLQKQVDESFSKLLIKSEDAAIGKNSLGSRRRSRTRDRNFEKHGSYRGSHSRDGSYVRGIRNADRRSRDSYDVKPRNRERS